MNLRKIALLIFAGAAGAGCGGGGDAPLPAERKFAASASTPGLDAVADEVVVKLHRSSDLEALLGAYPLTLVGQFGQRPIYRLRIAVGAGEPVSLAQQLAADARVKYAEPNFLDQTPESRRAHVWAVGGDSGQYATQWNAQALRLSQAHAVSTGAGVKVAVLDSGVDASHPALAGRIVAGFDFVDFDPVAAEEGTVGDAGYGHGTHVASLVAQVAPQAAIMPVRVLDRSGIGNIWVLAEGLLHAVDPDRDPATNDGVGVINISLGTLRPTNLLRDIVRVVTCEDDDNDDDADADSTRCRNFRGAVVVSAAGNSGDQTRHYPAAEHVPGAIAVAASSQAGTLASFSTRGDWVKVAAPGELVIGALPGGGWGVWSGTSMAAPMVAGAAALLRAADPGWKPSDVTGKLQSDGRALCLTGLKQIDPAKTLTGVSGVDIACP